MRPRSISYEEHQRLIQEQDQQEATLSQFFEEATDADYTELVRGMNNPMDFLCASNDAQIIVLKLARARLAAGLLLHAQRHGKLTDKPSPPKTE